MTKSTYYSVTKVHICPKCRDNSPLLNSGVLVGCDEVGSDFVLVGLKGTSGCWGVRHPVCFLDVSFVLAESSFEAPYLEKQY